MLVHSTALHVHQPFDTVMANSGVKTRSFEQTMLSDEAHMRWLRIVPQRRIQRQMTSPIPPRGVCSNLAGLCCSYRVYGILHCYVICLV